MGTSQKLNYFLSNIGEHFIDHHFVLSLLRKNSGGISPFVDVWNKDQNTQLSAGLKDEVWPLLACDPLMLFSGRKLLRVFCRVKLRVLLSERNCLCLSMTQMISLHIKLQETVPAGSISVFITQSHNFPPGRKLGKHAPSLAVTFKDENRKIIVAVFISEFLSKFLV